MFVFSMSVSMLESVLSSQINYLSFNVVLSAVSGLKVGLPNTSQGDFLGLKFLVYHSMEFIF